MLKYGILWEIPFWRSGSLTWCCGNSSRGPQPVPVPVSGQFSEPFVLISLRTGDKISLRAVSAENSDYSIPVNCILDKIYVEQCRASNSTIFLYRNETGIFDTGNQLTETYDELDLSLIYNN